MQDLDQLKQLLERTDALYNSDIFPAILILLAPTPLPRFVCGADERLFDLLGKFASPYECARAFFLKEMEIVSKRKERKICLLFL